LLAHSSKSTTTFTETSCSGSAAHIGAAACLVPPSIPAGTAAAGIAAQGLSELTTHMEKNWEPPP
jgi:hypothetical protein